MRPCDAMPARAPPAAARKLRPARVRSKPERAGCCYGGGLGGCRVVGGSQRGRAAGLRVARSGGGLLWTLPL